MSGVFGGGGGGKSFVHISLRSVPAPLKKALRWTELRGPLSVTFASVFGLSLALVDERFFPNRPFSISATGVISAILLVMDVGNAESFYLSTTFRVLGTICGVTLGLMFSVIEDYIAGTYKDVAARTRHEEDWKLITFRTAVLATTILCCTLLMKRYPKYAFPIVIMAVQTPAGMFATSLAQATSIALSAIAAVLIAVFSTVTFENISTEGLLMDTTNRAIQGVLSVLELAIQGDPAMAEPFREYTEQVHKAISQAESSIATYNQWRTLTCRGDSSRRMNGKGDLALLVQPMRPVFYQAYSLYWANAECFGADRHRSRQLFCDTEQAYQQHFAPHLSSLLESTTKVKAELDSFFSKRFHVTDEVEATLDRVLDEHFWTGMFVAQDHIRANYLEFRDECFSTFAQRCNVTDFARQMAMMTLALVEYFRGLGVLFLKDEDKRAKYAARLDMLADALDDLRKLNAPVEKVSVGDQQESVATAVPEEPVEAPLVRTPTTGSAAVPTSPSSGSPSRRALIVRGFSRGGL